MKFTLYCTLAILFFSCKTDKEQNNSSKQELDGISKKETIVVEEDSIYYEEDFAIRNREVDYQENKEVLDLLTTLPDSVTPNGNWKESERKEFRNIIKKNNFITDTVPFVGGFQISPKSFNVYLNEEETWNFYIYKIQPNEHILIVNKSKIVYQPKNGRKNEILAFTYSHGNIEFVPFENLFDTSFRTALLKQSMYDIKDDKIRDSLLNNLGNSDQIFITGDSYFHYVFDDPIAAINLPYMIGQDEFGDYCLKGNYAIYKLNPSVKKFELSEKGWGQ